METRGRACEGRSLCGGPAPASQPAASALGSSVNCPPPVLPRPHGHSQRGEAGRRRPWSLGLVPLTRRSRACRAVCRLTRATLAAVRELSWSCPISETTVGARWGLF